MTYYRIRLSYDLKNHADLLKVFFAETEGRERYIPLYNTRRLREVSLFFFAKILHVNPKRMSRDKRPVPIPYCNITSWFAIALAEMRARRILREKADCKQSNNPLRSS